MFTIESLMKSDWYHDRLKAKQQVDIRLWSHHVAYLQDYCDQPSHSSVITRLQLLDRLREALATRDLVSGTNYIDQLLGTLGTDPSLI
jgi:hypothetical protein